LSVHAFRSGCASGGQRRRKFSGSRRQVPRQ
jgi:hypothetical protein